MSQFQLDDVRRHMVRVKMAPGLGPNVAAAILNDHGDGAPDLNNLHPRLYGAVAHACIDVLDKSEHGAKLRLENRWQLFPLDHPQFVEATDALDAAWQHARELDTRETTEAHMLACCDKYKGLSATGPGTRSELYALLAERGFK
jgi:hypothetical protein